MRLWNVRCTKAEPWWAPFGRAVRACSASPSGMWCLCSQLRFFLLQIFYPFKANSLSSGWGVLSKEASERTRGRAHWALSPLPDGVVWVSRAGHRGQTTGREGNLCVSLRKALEGAGNSYTLWSQLHFCPFCWLFWSLSCPLSPYAVKNSSGCSQWSC